MDYALFSATALGAIGLFLMLPRERAPLARLGMLLGAMALAGLFLFLAQLANGAIAGATGGEGPPVYFYLFAAIMIAGAVGVVCQPRPVYAALYFVLVTLASAGMFVLLMADFMAIVLIIIYAGAILVTYVFVIMLASQGTTGGAATAPAYDRRATGTMASVVVAFVLVGAILQVLLPAKGAQIALPVDMSRQPVVAQRLSQMMVANVGDEAPADTNPTTEPAVMAAATAPASTVVPSNVQVLGASLYSQYSISLELAGILLTIALVGAVVISRKGTPLEQILGSGKLPSE